MFNPPPQFISYAATNKGVRAINEDSYLCDDTAHVWCVADGMGGHEDGDVASKSVIRQIKKALLAPSRNLQQTILDSASALHKAGLHQDRPMGTTLVACEVQGERMHMSWVGDSRAYTFTQNELKPLTKDHSYVQKLVDDKIISPCEANNHPNKNLILQSIGSTPPEALNIGHSQTSITAEGYLLCSDGLTDVLTDEQIAFEIARFSINKRKLVPEHLIKKALQYGSKDNITVIYIQKTHLMGKFSQRVRHFIKNIAII